MVSRLWVWVWSLGLSVARRHARQPPKRLGPKPRRRVANRPRLRDRKWAREKVPLPGPTVEFGSTTEGAIGKTTTSLSLSLILSLSRRRRCRAKLGSIWLGPDQSRTQLAKLGADCATGPANWPGSTRGSAQKCAATVHLSPDPKEQTDASQQLDQLSTFGSGASFARDRALICICVNGSPEQRRPLARRPESRRANFWHIFGKFLDNF